MHIYRMDFKGLPPSCYLSKERRAIPFIPEEKVELLAFDEKKWARKFPLAFSGTVDLRALQLTNIGLYSIALPPMARAMVAFVRALCAARGIKNPTVTETNGGVGGFSLHLVHAFARVNIVEINPVHAQIIKNNLQAYGLDSPAKKINIVVENYLDVMDDVAADVIISDPPWGGHDYSKQRAIRLGMNNINITCVVNKLYKKRLFKVFVLLAPRNFDVQDFLSNVACPDIVIKKLEKHYFIAVCAGKKEVLGAGKKVR